MDAESQNPLVSIIVVTYNSSKYILETLESAKVQTYKNIELIITDDSSTDNTIKICEDWLNKNKIYFKRTKLVTVEKNTGISANCNRGLYEAKGEWVKFIAGDDILLESCIEINLRFTKSNNNSFFFSKMAFNLNDKPEFKERFDIGHNLFNNKSNQLYILLKGNYLPAPTAFIKTATLIQLGGFDEAYPMMEDYPLWSKAIKNHHKIIFKDEETVIYRIHENSTSNIIKSSEDFAFFYPNFKYQESYFKHQEKVVIKDSILNFKMYTAYIHLVDLLQFKVAKQFENKKTKTRAVLFRLVGMLSPYNYYTFFKKNFIGKNSISQ